MAKTIRNGYYLASGGSTVTVHSNAGLLVALLISTAQSTVQTITLYDNTAASGTVIAQLSVQPSNTPVHITFPRERGIPFSTGLHINQGNCDVHVWSVDYG